MAKWGIGEAVGLAALSLSLTAALTYPLAFQLGRAGRVNTADGQVSIWNVGWVARALLDDPRGLYNANIFFPHRSTLAFSEPNIGAGLMAVPAYWATRDALLAHNVVVLLAFCLTTVTTYCLARYLTMSRRTALVAAIAFAFCPQTFARTAHIQLLMTFGMPLSLLAMHRFVDGPGVARATALGLALAAQALSCSYYGVFAGLAVALGVLFYGASRGLWRSVAYWGLALLAAGLAVGVVLPFFIPYLELQQRSGFIRTLADARRYSADWRSYVVSAAWAHRWWLPIVGTWKEVLFPGLMTTGFGVGAIVLVLRAWRRRSSAGSAAGRPHRVLTGQTETATFYTLVAALALWASFGPHAGLYTLLYRLIPVFSLLHAPARFGVLVTLALVVLAAITVARLVRGRQGTLVTGVFVVATAGELVVAPLPLVKAEPVEAAYRTLATLPHGPVAEFPFFNHRIDFHRHAHYMLKSTYHWKPLINGYSDHIPPDFRAMVVPLSSFPTIESFRILESRRARYVVFHLNYYDRHGRPVLLKRLVQFQDYLRPLVKQDDVWLFEIVAWPP